VVIDGTNIWVANYGSSNVTKLLASTGALVGTYAVGTSPIGVAFDGTNIWVANIGSSNVTKLSAYMSTVGSPYYPAGFAGPQQMAVALNGTTDYFSIGDVTTGHTANDLNVCVKFTVYGGSVPGVIGNGDWTIYIDGGGNVILYVNMSTPSSLASGVVTIGASNIVCFSYHYVADGTSILRGQLNNLAPVTLTTAHGPIPQTANVVKLGWDSVNDTKLNGSISEAWFTVNQPAMSAAQIAVAITDQRSLLTTKPVAGPETYTGPGGLCCPVSDAQCYWLPANVPCVKSTGIDLRGAASNVALQSQTIATGTAFTSPWAQANNVSAPTTNANQAVAPDGTTTADEVDIPAVSSAGKFSRIYQSIGTVTAIPWTFSCWAKAVTGTPTTYLMLTAASYRSAACSPNTSTWTRCSVTGTLTATTWYAQIGVDLFDGTQSAQSASAIYWWGCQVEAASTPGRYQVTLGTPFSGPADALSVAITPTNVNTWCVGVTLTADINNGTNSSLIQMSGPSAIGNPNTAELFWDLPDYGGLTVQFNDGLGGFIEWYNGIALANGTHKIVWCGSNVNHPVIDGVKRTFTGSYGTGGTLFSSMPTTLTLGHFTGITNENGKSVSRVCQGSSYKAVAACLARLP
jgi:hypothetical protein